MKFIISFLLIVLLNGLIAIVHAQKFEQRSLFFRNDSTFKIVQFTDIHWKSNCFGNASTLKMMNEVLDKEQPDLVVFTGDIVLSKSKKQPHLKKGWEKVTTPVIKHQIPWVVTLGNHDSEGCCCRDSVYGCFMDLPYNKNVEQCACNHDFCMPLLTSDHQISGALYFFDSNDYTDSIGCGTYAWIRHSQIEQYKEVSDQIRWKHNGGAIPALAFFHIPLPEYKQLLSENSEVTGFIGEDVAAPKINSGLFDAMLQQQDIMGIFCGHDHNNDFIGEVNDIALAYGRRSGSHAYGHLQKGARVILLYPNQRIFDTWIALSNERLAFYQYNNDSHILRANKNP